MHFGKENIKEKPHLAERQERGKRKRIQAMQMYLTF
jgi:hypothetical protein